MRKDLGQEMFKVESRKFSGITFVIIDRPKAEGARGAPAGDRAKACCGGNRVNKAPIGASPKQAFLTIF